jgi:hypothetical protein
MDNEVFFYLSVIRSFNYLCVPIIKSFSYLCVPDY